MIDWFEDNQEVLLQAVFCYWELPLAAMHIAIFSFTMNS